MEDQMIRFIAALLGKEEDFLEESSGGWTRNRTGDTRIFNPKPLSFFSRKKTYFPFTC